jgi:hypothetical protein
MKHGRMRPRQGVSGWGAVGGAECVSRVVICGQKAQKQSVMRSTPRSWSSDCCWGPGACVGPSDGRDSRVWMVMPRKW